MVFSPVLLCVRFNLTGLRPSRRITSRSRERHSAFEGGGSGSSVELDWVRCSGSRSAPGSAYVRRLDRSPVPLARARTLSAFQLFSPNAASLYSPDPGVSSRRRSISLFFARDRFGFTQGFFFSHARHPQSEHVPLSIVWSLIGSSRSSACGSRRETGRCVRSRRRGPWPA